MSNPYQSPIGPAASNAYSKVEPDARETRTVIFGQKMLIYAILGYLCAFPFFVGANAFLDGTPENPKVTPMFGLIIGIGILGLLASACCASVGIFRMGRVLFPGSTRIIYAIGVLIPGPVIGLIVMFVANSSATRYLKKRGIKVGFFGAKK